MTGEAAGSGTSYLGELRANIRPLLAASLGIGTSLPLFAYTNSVFAPFLIEEFGWSRSQFALVGLAMLSTLLVLPFIGGLTDRLGVRKVALIGTVMMPLCFIAYASQWGSFPFYVGIAVSALAIGSLTSPLVYTRLIAQYFRNAQGLALTIATCTPALLGAIAAPVLTWLMDVIGWRMTYIVLGSFVLACGLLAVWLTPAESAPTARPMVDEKPRRLREDFGRILRSRVFWIMAVAMFLCTVPTQLHSSQMNIMLLDNGLTPADAALIISIYAFGTIVGRLACGLSLDRFPTHLVTAISMGMPFVGYLLLATSLDAFMVIAIAMFLVGLSMGAENDLLSYLVARYFRIEVFSSTLSLLFCAVFLASSAGAIIISLTLKTWDSFAPFLYGVTGLVAVGGLLFLFLPKSADAPKAG